jgi:acylphosphatase
MIARHLAIFGRVQGVFYRDWTVETAQHLALTGWVRNRMDGSVEAMIQGDSNTVEHFIAQAHKGPPAAKVARIEVTEAEPSTSGTFEKLPTA